MSETTVNPVYRVEAPDVVAPRGGLLDVATIHEETDPHAGLSGVEYVTSGCSPAGLAPGLCCSAVTTDETKSWEAPQQVCGGPYAVYKGVGCDIFGESYEQAAAAALTRGEGWAVEKAFYEEHLSAAQVVSDGLCAAEGVGLLEQWASERYGGRPVFYTSRYGATVLGARQVLYPGMDSLTTLLGTPVAAMGGLGELGPDGTALEPGEFWLFATGAVNLWRTPVSTYAARNIETNESFAIAERVYSATVECFVAAVRIYTGCESTTS